MRALKPITIVRPFRDLGVDYQPGDESRLAAHLSPGRRAQLLNVGFITEVAEQSAAVTVPAKSVTVPKIDTKPDVP